MSNIMQDTKPKLYNPKRFEVGSLNRDRRRKDLVKITVENQAILRRLQEKQPTYSVTKWNEEHRKREELKLNLLEFPQKPGNSMIPDQEYELQPPSAPYGLNNQMSGHSLVGLTSGSQSAGNLRIRALNSAKPLGQKPLVRQAENLDENRIVLYKRSKQLGQGYYVVEISSTNTNLFIAAHDVESPESLLIELPEKRAQDILSEFKNDYEKMASSLQVINKRLVLLNPVSYLSPSPQMTNPLLCFQKYVQRKQTGVPEESPQG